MTITGMGGLTIITDPVFRMLGQRSASRTYGIEQLPRPGLVLISHRHLDHWDTWTMRRLLKDVPLVVRPGRIADDARRLGYTHVQELGPWEETEAAGLAITAVPAVHPGSEVGFVFRGEGAVYFAGDTGFDSGIFAAIGQRFDLDVALLPIGALRFLGWSGQMDLRQAVSALRLLCPKTVVGIHWGCLRPFPPFVEMPGTPQELASLLAKEQMSVATRGMAPLDVAEIQ
jgi:L-ascorbate metabolism protein UlaG (beta-lactamase superfamily)